MASPVIDIYIYTKKIVPVVRLSWLAPARQLTLGACARVTVVVLCLYVCLSVGAYSRTTGNEAVHDR